MTDVQIRTATEKDSRKIAELIVSLSILPWVREIPGEDSELFVADNARGVGIGTDILHRMKAFAQENGCSRVSLLNLEDRESYRRSYYPKRGWQERAGAKNMVKNLEIKGRKSVAPPLSP